MLDDARTQKEDAERALAEGTVEGRAELARLSSGVEDVRRMLPRDAVLVSFVRYERTALPDPKQPSTPAPSPSYGAFVMKGGVTRVLFVPLGTATAIEPLITEWRKAATGETISPFAARERAESLYAAAAGRLRVAIWDPLETEVGTARQVFIVPDGMLNLVNIGALSDRQGRYLVERASVFHHLSTERDVVVLAGVTPSAGGLLAVGNPAFDQGGPPARTQPSNRRSGCDASGPPKFGNLPGSQGEVAEITKLWAASGTNVVTVLSGGAASESAVKKALTGRRVVHFATHGFFLGEDCPPNAGSQDVRENPLLLSGLALAGANRRGTATLDEDDGILTAEEVASLNLNGVEWAVLSACDTGLGEIKAGEGVFGLRRAFQVAGARTVIMSLWSVDDQATRAWMRALYDARLRRGLSTVDAVHAASVSVLTDRRAKGQSTLPFYWAAFVAAGDWK
jgi:CHAT domain-containing protein